MASKLFRAIVGVGISLATASVACLGQVDDDVGGSSPSSGGEATTPDANAASPDVDGAHAPGSADAADGARADAAADGPKDAMLDAFCDASWPTTKGNAGGPTCGTIEDCHDAGPAPNCYEQADATSATCNPTPGRFPAWCVAGGWQCSTGGVPFEQCKCWVGQPCP